MELWIRSQDKESITKVSNIQYHYHNDLHIIGTYYDNLKILGTYKSKERALEVLDEIQNILKPKIFVKKDETELNNLKIEYTIREVQSLEYDIEQLDTYVYQMPKE